MASDAAKRHMLTLERLRMTEQVTYEHDAVEYELVALVDRGGPEPYQQGASAALAVTLLVDADPTVGVASPAAVDKGIDRVSVAERRGGTPAWRNIGRVADGGDVDFVRLELA